MVKATAQACRTAWRVGTFKRELAVIMLAFVGLLALLYAGRVLVFTPSDAALVAALGNAFGAFFSPLVTAVTTFAGLAFGLDAWSKQIQPGPKP